MNKRYQNNDEDDHPIFGCQINDGINCPFAELYLDLFPEYYDVE
jgi:hypothetical protein